MDGLSFRVITPRPNARRRFDRWWFQSAEPDRSLACLRHAAAMGRAEPQRFRLWLIGMGPTIGRKRRARRARGRRIEARRRQARWWAQPYRMKSYTLTLSEARINSWVGFRSKAIGPMTRLGSVQIPTCIDDSFLDPSLGELWKERADA